MKKIIYVKSKVAHSPQYEAFEADQMFDFNGASDSEIDISILLKPMIRKLNKWIEILLVYYLHERRK